MQEGLYAYWVSFYIDTSGGLTVLVAQSGSRLSSAAASLLGGGRLGWMLIVAALILLAVRRRGIVLILAAPILAAMALSALEALPLGGGRTDIYLLPLLVVLSGAATHELAQSSGGPTIAIGLSAWDTVRYPQQDVRGLIEAAEATAQDDSVIIVYPATRFAYVLYTEAPTTFSRSNTEITGFVFTIDDPQVTVLTPHRDDPEGYRPELDAVLSGRTEAWFISSHWRDDIDEVHAWASENGFTSEETVASGARMHHWTRDG